MGTTALVAEDIEAGARYLRAASAHLPVNAAFWLLESEGADWRLCIASDSFPDGETLRAYETLIGIAEADGDEEFKPILFMALNPADERAVEAAEIAARFPRRAGVRLRQGTLGGKEMEEAYVYVLDVANRAPRVAPSPA